MAQDIFTRFRGGCMMLLRKDGDTVVFLGTAFLAHPDGFLLTTAHNIQGREHLLVAPQETSTAFEPTTTETVTSCDVDLIAIDETHDLALLKLRHEFDITCPDHMIGVPDETPPGSGVMWLGYPFGFQHIFNQFIRQSLIAAKIKTQADVDVFLFDGAVHPGMCGAPLIAADDRRVIGVVGGLFVPPHAKEVGEPSVPSLQFSFAVSIKYGVALLEAQGATIV